MIVAEPKPIEEILEILGDVDSVLAVGCGGCTSVCLTGGQKEVDGLMTDLDEIFKKSRGRQLKFTGYTVERQCELEFVVELDELQTQSDVIVSLGCGAGTQFIAERYPHKPVYPALNTVFVGVNRDLGWYEEKCRSCGDCQLAYTGCICPVTRCAKSIFNGPCGGTQGEGSCEIDPDTPCAWVEIYRRLSGQNRIENIEKIRDSVAWRNQKQRSMVLAPYAKPRRSK